METVRCGAPTRTNIGLPFGTSKHSSDLHNSAERTHRMANGNTVERADQISLARLEQVRLKKELFFRALVVATVAQALARVLRS